MKPGDIKSTTASTQPHAASGFQVRVQAAVLRQFVQDGTACCPTTAAICPGMDPRDLEVALAYLIEDGSIDGPPRVTLESLVELAQGGGLTLTAHGRRRQDQDAA
jgi:hypothetical protein